jgi:hypothetical protein
MADPLQFIEDIAGLPHDWHASGTLPAEVVRRAAKLIQERFPKGLSASAETGCGKSTLLLSRLSRHHTCFAIADDAVNKVKGHRVFNPGAVEFVLGPSQLTLRQHRWRHQLDFALIDGAHGWPFPDLDYYFLYPQLTEGAILAIDDIHIPSITNMYHLLCEDEMWTLVGLEVYTAFFVRTQAPVFDPVGDNWFRQKYNQARFPHKEQLVPVLGENWWLK